MHDFKWHYGALMAVLALLLVLTGAFMGSNSQEQAFAQDASAPNRIVFASGRMGAADLWIMNLDGSNPRALFREPDSEEGMLTCGPNGDILIFESDRQGDRELYRARFDGTEFRPLTDTEGENHSPAWSPVEPLVAFVSTRNGDADIWLMDSGGGNVRQLTVSSSEDMMPSWSADGQRLLYSSNREGSFDIFMYDLETEIETRLTFTPEIDEFYPVYTPQDAIGYVAADPETPNITALYLLQDLTDTAEVFSVSGGQVLSPYWLTETDVLLSIVAEGKTDVVQVDLLTGQMDNLTMDGAANRYARPCYVDAPALDAIAAQPTIAPPTAPPTATITPIPSATPVPSVTPTVLASPTIPPPPVPQSHRLNGLSQVWQLYNRCSASALTIQLSYFNTGVSRDQSIRYLNPAASDVSVRLEEMIPFVEQQGLRGIIRTGGTMDMLRGLVAGGFPVLVENTYYHEAETWESWMSHNRVIMGYDDDYLYAFDSLLGSGSDGSGRPISYNEFDEIWRHFNRVYLVLYRPGDEALLQRIMGAQWDTQFNAQHTLEQARSDYALYGDPFSLFNIGSAQLALGQYPAAAATFDQVQDIGLPWRFFWYRFEIFESYLAVGRYDDVLALTRQVFNGTDGVDEMYYYIARAYEGLGNYDRAEVNYNFVLDRTDGRYPEALAGLDNLQVLAAQPTATPAVALPPLQLNMSDLASSGYIPQSSYDESWLWSRETWIGDEFAFIAPEGLPAENISGVLTGTQISFTWDDATGAHRLTLSLEAQDGALKVVPAGYTVNGYYVEADVNEFARQLTEQILLNSLRPGSYHLVDLEPTTTNLTLVFRMPVQNVSSGQYIPYVEGQVPDDWFISTEIWTPDELFQLAESGGMQSLQGVIFNGEQIRYNWQQGGSEHVLQVVLEASTTDGDLIVVPVVYTVDGEAGDVATIERELAIIRESLLFHSIPPGQFFLSRIDFSTDNLELVFLAPAR